MKSVRMLVVLIAFIAPFDGSAQEKELQKFVKKFMKEMADWDDISSFIHPEIGGYDTLITDRFMIQDYYLESYTDTTFTVRSRTMKSRGYCSRTTFHYVVFEERYFLIPSAPNQDRKPGFENWYDPWVLHERLCETKEEKD